MEERTKRFLPRLDWETAQLFMFKKLEDIAKLEDEDPAKLEGLANWGTLLRSLDPAVAERFLSREAEEDVDAMQFLASVFQAMEGAGEPRGPPATVQQERTGSPPATPAGGEGVVPRITTHSPYRKLLLFMVPQNAKLVLGGMRFADDAVRQELLREIDGPNQLEHVYENGKLRGEQVELLDLLTKKSGHGQERALFLERLYRKHGVAEATALLGKLEAGQAGRTLTYFRSDAAIRHILENFPSEKTGFVVAMLDQFVSSESTRGLGRRRSAILEHMRPSDAARILEYMRQTKSVSSAVKILSLWKDHTAVVAFLTALPEAQRAKAALMYIKGFSQIEKRARILALLKSPELARDILRAIDAPDKDKRIASLLERMVPESAAHGIILHMRSGESGRILTYYKDDAKVRGILGFLGSKPARNNLKVFGGAQRRAALLQRLDTTKAHAILGQMDAKDSGEDAEGSAKWTAEILTYYDYADIRAFLSWVLAAAQKGDVDKGVVQSGAKAAAAILGFVQAVDATEDGAERAAVSVHAGILLGMEANEATSILAHMDWVRVLSLCTSSWENHKDWVKAVFATLVEKFAEASSTVVTEKYYNPGSAWQFLQALPDAEIAEKILLTLSEKGRLFLEKEEQTAKFLGLNDDFARAQLVRTMPDEEAKMLFTEIPLENSSNILVAYPDTVEGNAGVRRVLSLLLGRVDEDPEYDRATAVLEKFDPERVARLLQSLEEKICHELLGRMKIDRTGQVMVHLAPFPAVRAAMMHFVHHPKLAKSALSGILKEFPTNEDRAGLLSSLESADAYRILNEVQSRNDNTFPVIGIIAAWPEASAPELLGSFVQQNNAAGARQVLKVLAHDGAPAGLTMEEHQLHRQADLLRKLQPDVAHKIFLQMTWDDSSKILEIYTGQGLFDLAKGALASLQTEPAKNNLLLVSDVFQRAVLLKGLPMEQTILLAMRPDQAAAVLEAYPPDDEDVFQYSAIRDVLAGGMLSARGVVRILSHFSEEERVAAVVKLFTVDFGAAVLDAMGPEWRKRVLSQLSDTEDGSKIQVWRATLEKRRETVVQTSTTQPQSRLLTINPSDKLSFHFDENALEDHSRAVLALTNSQSFEIAYQIRIPTTAPLDLIFGVLAPGVTREIEIAVRKSEALITRADQPPRVKVLAAKPRQPGVVLQQREEWEELQKNQLVEEWEVDVADSCAELGRAFASSVGRVFGDEGSAPENITDGSSSVLAVLGGISQVLEGLSHRRQEVESSRQGGGLGTTDTAASSGTSPSAVQGLFGPLLPPPQDSIFSFGMASVPQAGASGPGPLLRVEPSAELAFAFHSRRPHQKTLTVTNTQRSEIVFRVRMCLVLNSPENDTLRISFNPKPTQ